MGSQYVVGQEIGQLFKEIMMKISGKKAIKIPGKDSGKKKVKQLMAPLKQPKSLLTHRTSRGK
jgi:hypothetical protein